MLKYILTAILIAFFTACSAPKPKHAPTWYTSPPKDFQFIYAVAAGKTLTQAKNKAISNLRSQMLNDINAVFKNKTTKIKLFDGLNVASIYAENEHLINTMSLIGLKIDKSEVYKEDTLILIKIPRESIFEKFNLLASKRLSKSKKIHESIKDDDIWIKKYTILTSAIENYPKMASIIEAQSMAINTYNARNDINYLNTLAEEYTTLKNELSIYVLSDINSRIYVKPVKEALIEAGITLSSKPLSEKSMKLLITSTTENIQDYSFNKSKSLVKYSTYDLNKKLIAFRQHTFAAKSRRGYSDAKAQTAVHEKSKIKKLGIFDFIGIK